MYFHMSCWLNRMVLKPCPCKVWTADKMRRALATPFRPCATESASTMQMSHSMSSKRPVWGRDMSAYTIYATIHTGPGWQQTRAVNGQARKA
mmetsp:Transcript_54383/g.99783  ORF Transcript_54383/g.99783 Transcript_54383/m.99783 type:complete len:92 (+) Transcript_54383:480-755(+)